MPGRPTRCRRGTTPAEADSDVYCVFFVETDAVFSSAPATATLDNDGNAVFASRASSCATGASSRVSDEVEAGVHG